MNVFYQILANVLVVAVKSNFVWFALTYWVYLSTKSVISTSLVGGTYLIAAALSSLWFGSIVDHHRKKRVMIGSGLLSLCLFTLSLFVITLGPIGAFTTVISVWLWGLIVLLLGGVIAGNLYGIAVPILVTMLVPAERRDRANGMVGTVMGISFAITSVASGLVLGFWGMTWVLALAIGLTIVSLIHLLFIRIPENKIVHIESNPQKIDVSGTFATIQATQGLLSLIFFTTFNNFVGGVFMALMDAYGLTLVSVQVWGLLWGFLSLGFILGGLLIAKFGLGKNPLVILFRVNIILWMVCIFFTVQPSIILLSAGALIWMILVPFIEAIEQTIIQKVVPLEKQGRVFGFPHSVEQAASPLTAFFIGPITQWFFIPYMTTGKGVELIGSWFGVGPGRGIALVFIISGIIGLMVTLVAMRSKAYKLLARVYSS